MKKENKIEPLQLNYRKDSLRKLFLYAVTPLVLLSGGGAFYLKKTAKASEKETISYMVDTLLLNHENYAQTVTVAQYCKATDKINTFWLSPDTAAMGKKVISFVKARADMLNKGLKKFSSLLHENRHKHNYQAYKQTRAKFYKSGIGFLRPEHQAELFIHDEISANIVQILYARDLYRSGVGLDSIPLDSKAYKEFLQSKPQLTEEIGKEEIQTISLVAGEWVKTFRDHYGTSHGIAIAGYIDNEIKKKKMPSKEESQKIFDQIIGNYYSFNYHGKTVQIPFEQIDLSDKVKKTIDETLNPQPKDQKTVEGLRKTQQKKQSNMKKGSGQIFKTPPLPNYNPKIR